MSVEILPRPETGGAGAASALHGGLMSASIIVSERDAEPYTGLSVRTLQRLRLTGQGPSYVQLTGRRIAYRLSDLEEWVAQRVVSSTADATVRGIGGVR
ncbi:helix-turn-helix transcriptional regulator [Brytella acorum]|uniref:DNA-binding protein n=1 Tax=Brytella acorum TaxID=2959299 RepID=A0AA35V2C6_9PROT|nr:helix-turn-helix domain-containing protein [Brytella acorum]MDF3625711.1 DNA-binding protein [Brytella acorum]CAI9121340.1 DNA-binding protein [Brytella acorum]